MKLLFMIGAGAVGKMTVGQELMKITGMKLFHNHMTIEPVIDVLGNYNGHVVSRLREVIFEEFAKSDNYGMNSNTQLILEVTAIIHDIACTLRRENMEIQTVHIRKKSELTAKRHRNLRNSLR